MTGDEDLNDEQRDQLETSARHLYGLIHARFIITSRGLAKMVRDDSALRGHPSPQRNGLYRGTRGARSWLLAAAHH